MAEEIRLRREEVWQSGPNALPMPTLYGNGSDMFLDPEHTVRWAPTDDDWRSGGWFKRGRWCSEWEDVP